MRCTRARRQDSETGGGAEINFGGAREVYLCEFERGTWAREIYSSVDQTNKVKTKKKGSSAQFHNYRLKILTIFHEFLSENQKNGLCPKSFIKSGVSPQKLQKYVQENTNLGVSGLDLHSNSPKPVNFFGAQSSLGGPKQSFGGHGPGMPPRGAGPGCTSRWLEDYTRFRGFILFSYDF